MKLFVTAEQVKDPEVIKPYIQCGKKEYGRERLAGKFRRVFPHDGKEWAAIMLMDLHVHRFAPASGEGIIISEEAFRQFQS
jgi:hypothetical protein